jgi:dipeptidyl aminopeptidase/acylaminoacyl peptidase
MPPSTFTKKVTMRRFLLAALLFPTLAAAQQPRALTPEDYQRAVTKLIGHTAPLVTGWQIRPTWLDDGRFWYRNITADSSEIVMLDPIKRMRSVVPAAPTAPPQAAVRRNEIASPDKKRAVFIRNHNLWVRDLATNQETQLTRDGVKDYGYATNNAGWIRGDAPVVLWSPDSKKVATFQHDGRRVRDLTLVRTDLNPVAETWKYPLVGDSVIFMIERVIVDVDNPNVTRLKLPPDAHRSTVCDHVTCDGDFEDVQWSSDATQLAFVSSSRDHKQAVLRIADVATGNVRDVLEERVATQYESGFDKNNWYVLFPSNEVIWYSERDDWGHLYLYDLRNGKLKHQITRGAWPVWQVEHVDEKTRTIYFWTGGREPGRDPYFGHLYRVALDGKNLRLLTPENANHAIMFAPDHSYFIDSYSTPATPPITVMRDLNGKELMVLERADISRLLATGWTPPIPFTVKARDGKTDLYGLMHRPANFDSTRTYPIINYIYPGPQGGSVGSRSFQPSRGDQRALAELGFIVIAIDGMGNPQRSKSFHDKWYGNMGDNTIPDQVTGMQQLAQRHKWIDLSKAGIYGHSGGGNASTGAILQYPDFFKVAVSQAGNHDNRLYEDDWGERYQGMLRGNNYDNQANQLLAKNLKGKLLLAHGTMDDNVPYYSTLLMVNELIKHNKDFDQLILPNRRHGFGNEPYMMRKRWDYFVRHLMGAEPPREFEIVPAPRRPTL